MLALALTLFVWQDQLCRAILIVKTSAQFGEHKRVRQFYKKLFLKRGQHRTSLLAKNALARWLDKCSTEQVFDTAQFSAHSTRAASTSAALSQWRASGRCATSGRMELGVNIYPVSGYRKEPAVKYGASPVGFLSPQKTRVSAVKL